MELLNTINFAEVGIVIGIFAGIAILLTALILIVSKVCKVEADEKMEEVLSHLAGANCGGCGCTGCEGFAKQLCSGESTLDSCHVTSSEEKEKIAAILGVTVEKKLPTVSVLHCNGGINAADAFVYVGERNCPAEHAVFGGHKQCKEGCMGGGSCINACPEHAISLKDGHAIVEPNLCISCGLCISTCPKRLFTRIPISAKVYIACSTHCRGKDVMNVCKKGCIGCGLCVRNCPSGAITMQNNLPHIDYEKCTGCKVCVAKCPRKCILECRA